MTPLFPSVFEAVVFWAIVVLYFITFFNPLCQAWQEGGEDTLALDLLLPAIVVAIVIGYARIAVLPNWLFR